MTDASTDPVGRIRELEAALSRAGDTAQVWSDRAIRAEQRRDEAEHDLEAIAAGRRRLVEVEPGRWIDPRRIQQVRVLRYTTSNSAQRAVRIDLDHQLAVEILVPGTRVYDDRHATREQLDELALTWVADRLGDWLVER